MEMKLLDAYDIPWKGLSNGCHDFDFEIDDRFFGEFGDSGIQGGRMKAEVRMEKSAAMLLLHVTIEGEVTVECDRCLGDLQLPVNYTGDLTVKFSDETEDYDGEVMWLNPAEEKVPLAQYIYESIVLSLPYRKVHGTGPDGEQLCRQGDACPFQDNQSGGVRRFGDGTAQPGRYRRRRQTAAAHAGT